MTTARQLEYKKYDFTPILGWSVSRHEVFDKCKRQYFYTYYARYVRDVPLYRMKMLKELTSVALEVGNVVHDVLEAFLRRLQKSDDNIDEQRFFEYAAVKTREYFTTKTFLETRYGVLGPVDIDRAQERVRACLATFIGSPVYSWIFMKALRNKQDWMMEPPGYGETRLRGLKAYCKMDFLFPADGEVAVLDWKTGRRDEAKHSMQVMGYAAAASVNFGIPIEHIFPRIIYLSPAYDELELRPSQVDLEKLFATVEEQTQSMYAFCSDVERNVPLPIESFEMSPSRHVCDYCSYQEICFPERASGPRPVATL